MKVVLNHRPLQNGSKTRGVGVYTRELLTAFHRAYPHDHIIPSSHPAQIAGADLIHYPFFDPFFLTLPRRFTRPTVVTIHDLIPLRFPDHFPVGLRGRLKFWLQRQFVRRADHIITDSQASQADITTYLGIPASRITVIPLAHRPEKVPSVLARKIAAKYKLPERYVLYVGDINWNKNVPGLIEAFSQQAEPDFDLVFVGKVFSTTPNIPEWHQIAAAIANCPWRSRIHLIGFVPSHHLPVFYDYATLYVQPSWYEGFGLPLLEAMTYGCPILSSNQGSLPEVGGDAVAYFDPHQADLATQLASLLHDTARRNDLSRRGLQRVKNYSWVKVAQATKAVYDQVLATRHR